jgi:NAD(P)-dependent dehydrogenase (short-subunit alcohol dehydrogenase family)
MMGTRWGRIIAISSVALTGNRSQVGYSAAKPVIGAVKSLARVASRHTVNGGAGHHRLSGSGQALDRQQIAGSCH